MANIVQYYDSAAAIGTSGIPLFDITGQTTMLRVKNEDALDIILKFGSSTSSNDMLIKAGDDFLTAFVADCCVYAYTSSGTTSANIFVQVFEG